MVSFLVIHLKIRPITKLSKKTPKSKNRASSELLYKSNRLQVSMVYRLINHLGCWWNTRRIRKSLVCGS